MRLFLDTRMLDVPACGVECTTHIEIYDEDVMLSVIAFGDTYEQAKKNAYEKMNRVLCPLLGLLWHETVLVEV